MPETRQEAVERGLKHYITGRPCKRGHNAPRYTSTGNCTMCSNVTQTEHMDKLRARQTGTVRVVMFVHPADIKHLSEYNRLLLAGRGVDPSTWKDPEELAGYAVRDPDARPDWHRQQALELNWSLRCYDLWRAGKTDPWPQMLPGEKPGE